MTRLTISFGTVLILLGVVGYLATGAVSITALIPAFFGLPILILGLLSQRPRFHKHAVTLAGALALLGFFGSARGLPQALALLTGGEVARPAAAVMQALMALLCLTFAVLVIRALLQRGHATETGDT